MSNQQKIKTKPDLNVDVLVIGSGPAGITAALAAARNGVKVALVERYGFMGGNATNVVVTGLCGFYTSGPNKKRIVGGIGWEIIQALNRQNAVIELFEVRDDHGIGIIPYNHEVLKIVLDQMVTKEKIILFLHSIATDVIMSASTLQGVVVVNKSGQQRIFADVVIDATGDGDLAEKAGAEYEMLDEPQPMTMIFTMANVDVDKALSILGPKMRHLMQKAIESKDFLLTSNDGGYTPIPGMPGVIAVNLTRIRQVVGTEVEDLTRAEIEGRQQVTLYADFLCKYIPGFKNAFLASISSQVGVRETRRIIGEYVLTEDDILSSKKFDDGIGLNAWPVEIHEAKSGNILWKRLPDGESCNIPYRCLVPKVIDGLLVAGRCISTTHGALASTRASGPCMVIGQAAGTAAAMAAKKKIIPRSVDIFLLKETLRSQGAKID